MPTTNEWEKKVKSIGEYLGCNQDELWSEISKLITQAKQEERERIVGIIEEIIGRARAGYEPRRLASTYAIIQEMGKLLQSLRSEDETLK